MNPTTLSATPRPEAGNRKPEVGRYANWCEAFALCREMDRPITVAVPVADVTEIARIFPSGRCRHLRYEKVVAA